MERIVRQTMLFDFYGELLTEHQQRIYEEVVVNDTGFSEVAEQEGISRQSVHEMIRRCDRQLDLYEEKLHMMERFLALRREISLIRQEAEELLERVPPSPHETCREETCREDGRAPADYRLLRQIDHVLSLL